MRPISLKLQNAILLLQDWVNREMATKRMLQKLLGVLLHLSRVVRPGRLFVNCMLVTMRNAEALDMPIALDSRKMCSGGSKIFVSGMGSLCSSSLISRTKSSLTQAQTDGLTGVPVMGVLICEFLLRNGRSTVPHRLQMARFFCDLQLKHNFLWYSAGIRSK